VDVRDVAGAVAACVRTAASGLYNIAGAEAISNLNLARLCIQELSSSSTVEFAEKRDPEEGAAWDVSIAKARRELQFEPCHTMAQSIKAIADECHHSE
jgi:nucleoside-diphosphate-sugar epimerase